MTPPSNRALVAGAATFSLIVAGLIAGNLLTSTSPDGLRATVEPLPDAGTIPPDGVCVWTQGYAAPYYDEATGNDVDPLDLFPDLRRDAGRYAITRVYAGSASDEDGGTEEVGALPPGFIAMPETQWMEPCDGGPAFFVAFQGQAEFPCSCRVTAECEWNIPGQWEPAPIGSTLSPGRWRDTSDAGTACYRKVCMEIAGESSWPAECPTE